MGDLLVVVVAGGQLAVAFEQLGRPVLRTGENGAPCYGDQGLANLLIIHAEVFEALVQLQLLKHLAAKVLGAKASYIADFQMAEVNVVIVGRFGIGRN